MRVVVFGAGGMLGSAVLRLLAGDHRLQVTGTLRAATPPPALSEWVPILRCGVDIRDGASIDRLLDDCVPDVVINCIGVRSRPADPALVGDFIFANACWPHELARAARAHGARTIHISSDGVFSGARGDYSEADTPDGADDYAMTKRLGEVVGDDAVTLRLSIIGHEPARAGGLVDWFLAQAGPVRGFRRSRFNGLPTVEVAEILRDRVLPDPALNGIYHLGAEAVDKHRLLELIAQAYGHAVEIVADDSVALDRTLDTRRFRDATGYVPAPWPALLAKMRAFG